MTQLWLDKHIFVKLKVYYYYKPLMKYNTSSCIRDLKKTLCIAVPMSVTARY